MPKTITCINAKCGATIDTEEREIGEMVTCPSCGTPNQVLADFGAAFDISAITTPEKQEHIIHPARQICTNCGAVLGVRDAVCPKCGGDVRTGVTRMRITEDQKERAGMRRSIVRAKRPVKKRNVVPYLIGAVIAGVIIVVVLVVFVLG